MHKSVSTSPDLTEDFRRCFRFHAGSTSIITATSKNGKKVGLVVTSLTSVSINPPTMLFSASGMSSSTPELLESEYVAVHLLKQADKQLAIHVSTHGSDRFSGTFFWKFNEYGTPVYEVEGPVLYAQVKSILQAADSYVFIIELKNIESKELETSDTLIHVNREWVPLDLGSER